MKHFRLIFSLMLLFTLLSEAKTVDTSTRIFAPSFRSLQVSNPDNFGLPPIIRLGSNDRIVISFDEIEDDIRYMRYRLIHCNADWQPSQLLDSEIVDGFNLASIEDYAFSENTFVHFVNYRIEIPNDQISPLVSGNYLLQVMPEDLDDQENDVLLQARFQVSDNIATIVGEASGRTDRGFNTEFQQPQFMVTTGQYRIEDPFTELIAVVEQNFSNLDSRAITRPLRIDGDKIIYEHLPQLIFPAGNEYLRFETVRTNYTGMHTESMRYEGDRYNAYLMADYPREGRQYEFDRTQNGRFRIDEYNATDPDLGADYVDVHFTLKMPRLNDASVFVDGEFTNSIMPGENRMTYNPEEQAYQLSLPLKQGSYNYRYVTVKNGKPDPTDIDGNHYETLNTYNISLYQRKPGFRADRLLGTATIQARP